MAECMPTEHLLLHSPFNKGQWRQSNRKKSFPQGNTAVIYIHGNETWCQARLSHPPPRPNFIQFRNKFYNSFLEFCRTFLQQYRSDGKDEPRMIKMLNRHSVSVFVVCRANCDWLLEEFFFLWRCDPTRVMASSFFMFLDHTQRRTTVGRTPLDEWSARRRDLYVTTHNTHNRETSMPPVGFEPTVSAGERPQTYALDRAATGTGNK